MTAPSVRVLIAAATLVLLFGGVGVLSGPGGRRSARRRLRALVLAPSTPGRRRRLPRPARLIGPVVGVAVLVSYPQLPGLLAGAVLGVLADQIARRWEPRSRRLARIRAERDLPFALDLAAAALRSGASPARCAQLVGAALGGPLGDRLGEVGRALSLGGAPATAWGALRGIAGAERVASAAVRGSHSGAALAGALSRIADDLRSARLAGLEARAHRAGVLVVLPLGLCFLPAFVTGGLVPVVVSMLGKVLP